MKSEETTKQEPEWLAKIMAVHEKLKKGVVKDA